MIFRMSFLYDVDIYFANQIFSPVDSGVKKALRYFDSSYLHHDIWVSYFQISESI